MTTPPRSLTSLFPAFKTYLETSAKPPLGAGTQRRYLYELRVFARHLQDRPLDDISPVDLTEWHQMLVAAGAHAKTIEQKHSAVKRFLRYADEILEDPAASRLLRVLNRTAVNAPREPTREKWSLTPEQARKMLTAASRHGARGPRDRAMLHMLFATGARRAEVTGLRLEKLDVDGRLAELLGKGNKWRTVAFSQACQLDLRAWLELRTSWLDGLEQDARWAGRLDRQSLFLSVGGRAMTPEAFGKLVKETAREAGIRKAFWTHLTRHTFITDQLRSGTPISVVSLWVGHQDPTTTQGYVAESRENIRKEYDRALRRQAGRDGKAPASAAVRGPVRRRRGAA